jgi:preprotein translocase subunit SecF
MEFFKPGRRYDFLSLAKPLITASAIAVVASWVLVFTVGLNFGIDFVGGTEALVAFKGNVDTGDVAKVSEEIGLDSPEVVIFGLQDSGQYFIRSRTQGLLSDAEKQKVKDAAAKLGEPKLFDATDESGEEVRVQYAEAKKPAELQAALNEAGVQGASVTIQSESANPVLIVRMPGVRQRLDAAMIAKFGKVNPDGTGDGRFIGIERVETVGSAVGEQMRNQGILALLYALIGILLYVTFRFDLRFSPGAIIALFHDLSITLGVFVITGMEFNLPIIAALLAILGYSINDTIVVYDRIRESIKMGVASNLRETINISVSDTLSRTSLTSLTTFISVLAIYILGSGMTQNFAFAMMVGIIVGTYSSIYVASPFALYMEGFLKAREKVPAAT